MPLLTGIAPVTTQGVPPTTSGGFHRYGMSGNVTRVSADGAKGHKRRNSSKRNPHSTNDASPSPDGVIINEQEYHGMLERVSALEVGFVRFFRVDIRSNGWEHEHEHVSNNSLRLFCLCHQMQSLKAELDNAEKIAHEEKEKKTKLEATVVKLMEERVQYHEAKVLSSRTIVT
uniref:Uncharacterized protein n=1 Tax=Lotharella globosa TaxID=91324 RepID=A0A7S4DRR0_9EUKA